MHAPISNLGPLEVRFPGLFHDGWETYADVDGSKANRPPLNQNKTLE